MLLYKSNLHLYKVRACTLFRYCEILNLLGMIKKTHQGNLKNIFFWLEGSAREVDLFVINDSKDNSKASFLVI